MDSSQNIAQQEINHAHRHSVAPNIMKILDKIESFIAKTSVNGTFLAQVGHFSVSFILVEHLPGRHLWWALAMLAWATVKEWWFDTRFEGASFWNNLLDYTFYNLGIWAAYLLVR